MNKEKLQNYNSILSENNGSLEEINNAINELPDVSNMIEPFEITDASYLFYSNARLDIMEKLLSMCKKPITTRYMFYGASDVLNLDLSKLDTSLVSSMQYMFQGCNKITELDISHFNTSNVTDYSNFCNSCSSLKKLNVSGFTNEKTTDLSYFVARCSNLTEINLTNFLTPLVTTMYYMFWSCSSLASLNISSFDASKVRNIGNMFLNCNALTDLVFMNNLGKGYTQKTNNYSNYKLDLSGSKNLTHESLMDVINKLYDLNLTYSVANGGTLYTQQLVLGSTNMAKLTSEEINIAVQKGWVVS